MNEYQKLRNELMIEYDRIMSAEMLQKVLTIMDETARRYTFTQMETLPAIATVIPAEVNIYLASKKIEGLSDKTLTIYGYTLSAFFRRLQKPVSAVEPNDIRLYLFDRQNAEGAGNRTLDKIRQQLSSFFGWCVDEGYTEKNPCKNIKQIKYEKTQRAALTRLELEYVRQECKNNLRMSAIIEFLYSTGCRITEMCNVKLTDVDMQNGTVLLHGKGGKDRTDYLNDKCRIALQEYLNNRKQKSEYLFCSVRAPYAKLSKEIIDREFKQTFGELSQRISKPISPHIIRHTTATLGLQCGMDITQVQKMLGHASISTTMIYAEVSDNTVREAHKKYVV